jgi:hypothetical protein
MNIKVTDDTLERLTEIMQEKWDEYVEERDLSSKQEPKYLSAFFAGGQAILAALSEMQYCDLRK